MADKKTPSDLLNEALNAALMLGRNGEDQELRKQVVLNTRILGQMAADGEVALTEGDLKNLKQLCTYVEEGAAANPGSRLEDIIIDLGTAWGQAYDSMRQNAGVQAAAPDVEKSSEATTAEPAGETAGKDGDAKQETGERAKPEESVSKPEESSKDDTAEKAEKAEKEKGKKEKEPEITFSGIMEAAAKAGHKAGRDVAGTETELATDGLHGEEVTAMLAKVEEKLKGEKSELSEDATKALSALKAAAEQMAVHAAEAGKKGEHFLYEAGLNEPELKAVQEAQKVLGTALKGAEKEIKGYKVPADKFPRTAEVIDVPVAKEKDAKGKDKDKGEKTDGKADKEAKAEGEDKDKDAKAEGEDKDKNKDAKAEGKDKDAKAETKKEEPGVYANTSALRQARTNGQTMSRGAMVGAGALIAASALGGAAALRSGGGSPDPRNPNAKQEKKGWSVGKTIAVTSCALGAALGVAAFMRKENPMQTLGAFASRISGGRIGGQAMQR